MIRDIRVNLYDWHLKGSLDMCLMISQETQCPYSPGEWNGPFHFLPENEEQKLKVLDLLQTFELKHSH